MRAGQLRHLIEIQEHRGDEVLTDMGAETQVYTTSETVWGSIQPLTGREQFYAQQVDGRISHRITIRYYPGLTPKHRLRARGRVFNILSVANVDERDREMVVMCEERV